LPSRRDIGPRRRSFYVTATAAAVKLPALHRVNDQFLLSKKLQRAVPFGVNGVPEAAVNCRKHGDDRAHLMVVGRIIDFLANRKLRHRELPSRNHQRDYIAMNELTLLNYVVGSAFFEILTTAVVIMSRSLGSGVQFPVETPVISGENLRPGSDPSAGLF
jgi:hypothetical protein